MGNTHTIDSIHNYLRKNNFLAYRLKTPSISKKFTEEYLAVAPLSNKRNLHIKKHWQEIQSFGKPRKIVAMDLGGTNLNLFEIDVKENNGVNVVQRTSVDFYENKIYTPEVLFHDLKNQLDLFIIPSEDRMALKNLVFIFSYPIQQLTREDGYIDATCTYFGKMRKSEGIIGLQVGNTFQEYLRKNGYPQVTVSVTSDTPIYCLAAKGHQIKNGLDYDVAMNIIVGTGTNISAGFDEDDGFTIINTEFGDFKSIPLSEFDKIFDSQCDTPGRYLTEKMLSGAWQHQIFAIIIKKLLEDKIIDSALIENFDYSATPEMIQRQFIEGSLTPEQKHILGFIWKEVNKRGGSICAIVLAAIASQILQKSTKNNIKILITETGSVLQKGVGFREAMLDTLDNELGRLELGDKIEYTLINLPDQSALGAVIFDAFFPQ